MKIEDSTLRQGKAGQVAYKAIGCLFNLPMILMSNRKFRKGLLLPLYDRKLSAIENTDEVDCAQQIRQQKTIIYMVLPETTFSGGLSDRLRGIVSIYAECKRQNLPFRIAFEPLHLQDYLQPNKYDWRIDNEEIIWDSLRCYPCTVLTYQHNLRNRMQRFSQSYCLRHFLKKNVEQIHVYSNMATAEDSFAVLFHELFKPSEELQRQIDRHLRAIGGKESYISMTFRFRQLLGDFKEGGETLTAEQGQKLIKRCMAAVERMHNRFPYDKILVTADSFTFLETLGKCKEVRDYVYIIPGKVVHIGFTFDAEKAVYMKSFVDFYMLSYAKRVILMRDSLMYHSGFPQRAAMINGSEYAEEYI